MKSHRNAILTSIIIVILLAVLALFFFWMEETVPQDSDDQTTPGVISMDDVDEPENQLYLTIMTHMEHEFTDDENEMGFLLHVEQLRFAMELADTVGAILSIESEKPFAIANSIWGINILQEIFESGHGVQTHCDLGSRYADIEISAEDYSKSFERNKSIIDDLIGEENNLGCSGGGSINDWATAASLAGFKYLNGIVGAHLLAIPYENRPDEKWTDEYIKGDGWHVSLPEDIYEAIYPIPLADSNDLIADDDPVIIMMPGSIDRLDYAAEDEDDKCRKSSSCEFTAQDVDVIVASIIDVAEHYDPERGVAKMTVYIPSNLYVKDNVVLLNYFFSEIGKLEDMGLFNFGTHKEIYEAYIEQTGFDL